MNFNLSDVQASWRERGEGLGSDLGPDAPAGATITAAAAAGLLDPDVDLLARVVAIDAIAVSSPSSAVAVALHTGVMLHVRAAVTEPEAGLPASAASLVSGETVGAIALSSDESPGERDGRLTGRASWVAPLTEGGVVIVGARSQDAGSDPLATLPMAYAARLDHPDVAIVPIEAAGVRALVTGHVTFRDAPGVRLGPTQPIMAVVRLLLAAAGLGMGRRALREAIEAAPRYGRTGAGGEQTVQGLIADTATELDAAMLLTWKAATAERLSLAETSMAKLAVTEAIQRAVTRATQVLGVDSFTRGHAIERLSQDVRALELFAGRTEALRESVAQA